MQINEELKIKWDKEIIGVGTVVVPIKEVVAEEATVMAVSIEEAVVMAAVSTEEEAVVLIETQRRCIKRFVQNATKNVKFLLNQQKANQYIAKNVLRNENINSITLEIKLFCLLSYFFFYFTSVEECLLTRA